MTARAPQASSSPIFSPPPPTRGAASTITGPILPTAEVPLPAVFVPAPAPVGCSGPASGAAATPGKVPGRSQPTGSGWLSHPGSPPAPTRGWQSQTGARLLLPRTSRSPAPPAAPSPGSPARPSASAGKSVFSPGENMSSAPSDSDKNTSSSPQTGQGPSTQPHSTHPQRGSSPRRRELSCGADSRRNAKGGHRAASHRPSHPSLARTLVSPPLSPVPPAPRGFCARATRESPIVIQEAEPGTALLAAFQERFFSLPFAAGNGFQRLTQL